MTPAEWKALSQELISGKKKDESSDKSPKGSFPKVDMTPAERKRRMALSHRTNRALQNEQSNKDDGLKKEGLALVL